MLRSLNVYYNKILAGRLFQNEAAKLSFQYEPEYIAKNGMPISISMPLQEAPYEDRVVQAFFSNLLPDDAVRRRLAQYLGLSEKNSFSLLEVIGRECAGALSLYPENEALGEENIEPEILSDQKLLDVLGLLKSRPLLAGDDGLRLSLAGAQDKVAVRVSDDKISIVRGGMLTTHILKPIIFDIDSSVHNEFFCMKLARMVGIDVPNVEIRKINDTPFFLVERYDRRQNDDGSIVRLHQEDFCQALGIMPEQKYEREGGPSIGQCQQLIIQHSTRSASDYYFFLERVMFNYLIGNADAHGKNFSFLYTEAGPSLAPAYDLLSTEIYPELSSKMAMKIGGKYVPKDVFMAHWSSLVEQSEVAQKKLRARLKKFSTMCLNCSKELKEELGKDNITSPIFDKIIAIIEQRASRILREIEH